MPAKILVVDDEEDIVRAVQIRLEKDGHTVITARDGRAALDSIAASPPDLVVMDVMMPEIDGFEVLSQIKSNSETAQIPVVMLTGLDAAPYAAKGRELGCDFFWIKPYQLSDLSALVQRILEDYKD
ncbi:MAG: response regulator [Abitibacteriaceae bacterium]|nr:response regulator [Abditibacteriaceae bacterium]MBV9866627.1 response regulator [Abditibacteriaceae bacterium]